MTTRLSTFWLTKVTKKIKSFHETPPNKDYPKSPREKSYPETHQKRSLQKFHQKKSSNIQPSISPSQRWLLSPNLTSRDWASTGQNATSKQYPKRTPWRSSQIKSTACPLRQRQSWTHLTLQSSLRTKTPTMTLWSLRGAPGNFGVICLKSHTVNHIRSRPLQC